MANRSGIIRKLFVTASLCLGLFPAGATEFRGLWVDAFGPGFFNAGQVKKLAADCRKYNFNAVVVEMRRRGDAFYNSNYDPRTTIITTNFDALAEIIKVCHTGTPRIEVHCWVVSHFIWSWEKPPKQPNHIFNRVGRISKTASVESNDPTHPIITLNIMATVWKLVDISPPLVFFDFRNVTIGMPSVRIVRILSNMEQPLELSLPEPRRKDFAMELKPVLRGKEFELIISPISVPHGSPFQFPININTSCTNLPMITVNVSVLAAPPPEGKQ